MNPSLLRLPVIPEARQLMRLVESAPGGVWLDSSLAHPELGRFSLLGVDPFLTFTVTRGRCLVAEGGRAAEVHGDPWMILRDLLARYRAGTGELPLGGGGAMGYLGYDMGRHLERIPVKNPVDANLPEAYFGFYDLLMAVDHLAGETWLVSTGHPARTARGRSLRLEYLKRLLERSCGAPASAEPGPLQPGLHGHFSRASYCLAVERAKEYIAAGDIYQVNLSQRFWTVMDRADLYLRLRQATPVPFGAYIRLGEEAILCASPERFLHVHGDAVETRPIKGTRPRGRNPDEDGRLAADLMNNGKDRAELMMVVDLERNDLSRVCLPGSVHVPRLCGLESYANVHHLVSTITGTLRPGLDVFDLLRASFPGGSITGVPKIRAMEIIEELEPVRRGLYTGSIGYLGFDGSADLNIAIRTGWTEQGRFLFQVGGAVTAESDPDLEYEETMHKAAGLLKSIGV